MINWISIMRERLAPWLPAIFCAVLAVIVTVCNLWVYSQGGSDSGGNMIYMLNMPMCFFFVGAYLTKLRNDNTALRLRVDALDGLASDT